MDESWEVDKKMKLWLRDKDTWRALCCDIEKIVNGLRK